MKSKHPAVRGARSGLGGKRRHLVEALIAAQVLVVAVCGAPAQAGQLTLSAFSSYDAASAGSITPGPTSLYEVSLDSVLPTQMDEGLTEVDQKAASFNLLQTPAQLQADLLTDVEPVVIGPGGELYLTDGHHTFTALADSVWGPTDPTVFVNVIANYSSDTTAQFYQQMQADNLLLPLNDGVPMPVDTATGAPIPTSLTSMDSDVYRGLEYSILKNHASKFFPSATTTTAASGSGGNILGAKGSTTPGVDKETGAYADFVNAEAYRNANDGLGLPYLSVADVALATQWQLNGASVTTMPGVAGSVTAAQLPGFILAQNLVNSGGISDATLAGGAMDGNGNFDGLDRVNLGTLANPILIGTPNVGFVMELGNDNGYTVTLDGSNSYDGGTTITAGDLIVASDAALGAAPPASYTINPAAVLGSVQAADGIVFDSLTEGNGTLTIGTASGQYPGTAPFITARPIAVDGETATINVNGNDVELEGQLVSLGTFGTGIGNATGISDLTIDDLSAADNGKLLLSTASPYFYGNLIIGNSGAPIVTVTSDAALGNTDAAAGPVGEIELNGGTLQTGASFSAPERDMFLGGGSSIDVDGNVTSWGTLADTQRTLEIENSSTTSAGAISFADLEISATASLQLTGGATADPMGESVTFTDGIVRTGNDTLIISPAKNNALGLNSFVYSGQGTSTLIDGMAPAWMVADATGTGTATTPTKEAGPYQFLTYSPTLGYVPETGGSNDTTTLSAGSGSDLVNLNATSTTTVTPTGNVAAFALEDQGKTTLALGANTLTLGDGSDPAGLILNSGSAITGGTVQFNGSEGVIWLGGANLSDSKTMTSLPAANATISAAIKGTNGLTFAGSGGVDITAAASVSGPITIDSGAVELGAVNVFSTDASGILMDNTKTKPSPAVLNIAANNQIVSLDAIGNNSVVGLAPGVTLTLGDSVHNESSSVAATIDEAGTTAVAGALTLDGSGLFDFSGGSKSLNLATGSSIIVNNSAQFRVAGSEFTNAGVNVVLDGSSQLQFVENGGDVFANAVSGSGSLHLMSGTLQLTGVNNTYQGGTFLEMGSTLDVTTANLPTSNPNITDAGGTVLFDQTVNGSYAGVIGNGQELGSGPLLAGSLIKDDSTGANSGDVTLTQQQTFTGATDVEAGTLTLGAVDTLADSSGVTLGRVGGCVMTGDASCAGSATATATLALGADNTLQGLASDAANTTAVTLGSYTLTVDPASGAGAVFGGTISGSGGVVVGGSGIQVFSGTNTYTGGTTVNAGGDLYATTGAALGTGAVALVGNASTAATLTTGQGSVANALSIAGQAALAVAPGTTTTVSSPITDGASSGALLVRNTGVLDLTAANTYSGTTTVAAYATLELSGAGSIASTAGVSDSGTIDISSTNAIGGVVTVNSGGTLALLGGGSLRTTASVVDDGLFDISGAGGNVTLAGLSGNGTLDMGANSLSVADDAFVGALHGTAGVDFTGGTNTVGSGSTISGQPLQLSPGSTLDVTGSGSIAGATSVTLLGNAVLDISGASAAVDVTSLSSPSSSAVVNLGAGALVVTDGSPTSSYAGGITGTGSVTVQGGTLTLGGDDTFSGGITVDGGATLEINSGAALGSGPLTLTSSGSGPAVLATTATTSIDVPISVAGDPVFDVAAGTTTTIASVIADGATPGFVEAAGTGVLKLTAANTYTGATSVDAGAYLALSGGGGIAASSTVAVAGTLDISSTTAGASIVDLSGAGSVFLGAENLTISHGASTFSGVIGDGSTQDLNLGAVGGRLTVAGGTETLSGVNTYTGATSIGGGATLALAGAGSVAGSSGVADSGTLDISQTTAGATLSSLSGGGVVALGAKTLSLGGGTFTGVIADGGSGVGGALTLTGGSTSLSGVNTYTGLTTIDAGAQLALSGAGSIASSAGVVNDGTFAVNASAVTVKNYTQAASASLVEGVGLPLTVTGIANLNGSLTVDPATALAIGHYTLASAGTLNGQFTSVTVNPLELAAFGDTVSYAGNAVVLNVEPNAASTQAAVDQVAAGISAADGLGMSQLDGALGYDCDTFGAQHLCLDIAMSSAKESGGRMNDAIVTLGYGLNPQWRLGVFGDQQLGNASPLDGVATSARRPLLGGFVGWNARTDGTGLGVKAAVAVNASTLDIARMGSTYAEAATANTRSKGNATEVEASYTVPVGAGISATPYAGLRLAQLSLDGYTESGPVYPLTYHGVTQRTLDALMGVSLGAQLTDRLSGSVSANLTQNLSDQAGALTGSSGIAALSSFSAALPGGHYTSFGLGAGLGLDLGHDQRLNLDFSLQQHELAQYQIGSVSLEYSIGF